MDKNRLISTLLALSLAILPGCGVENPPASSSPAQEPSLSTPERPTPTAIPFTLAYYPDYSLHPTLAENRANLSLAPLLYEGLFQVDDTFQATPLLCQSWSTSEDALTWNFVLQPNVTFSDGTPLTGKLAAQALTTAMSPGSRYAGRISGLRAITGDETSVTITLNQPNSALPVLLDIPISLGTGDTPPGTGPYLLEQTEGEPSLIAKTTWWQDKSLPFQTIRLSKIRQADDLIASFDSGEVTLLDVDLTGTNALGYSGSYEVWDYNTSTLVYLGFNTVSGNCKDPRVRQALSLGIDRDSIATIPYARHAVPAALPVHPDSPLYNDALADLADYDPDTFVASAAELTSLSKPLKLVVNSENNAKTATAEYIAYQLHAAGLTVEVEKLPWDRYLTALAGGQFDLYLAEVMLTADFDLTTLLSSGGQLNYGGWHSEETDTLISALRAADASTRIQAANDLLTHFTQQLPIAPLCFKNGSVLTQWGRLTNLQPLQGNVFHTLECWTLDQ